MMHHALQRAPTSTQNIPMICPLPFSFKKNKVVNPYFNPYKPPEDPRWIRINIWENKRNPQWIQILYENQVAFESSPTLQNEWRVFYSFLAYNHLIPPYPNYTGLFRANHNPSYPFELKEIVPILDSFNVEENGTYFVAFTVPVENTSKIPLKRVNLYVKSIFDESQRRGEHRAVARKRGQQKIQSNKKINK